MDVRGRVAVVTGGASGIGRSLCLVFATRGAAAVVVADVDATGAAAVAQEITSRGTKAVAVRADVSRESDVRALVSRAEEAFGRRGIGVSCLCPQAVTTNLGATSLREIGGLRPPPAREGAVPSQDAGSVSRQTAVDGVLAPDQVAASVVEALAAGHFLILPHPEVARYERRRATDRDRWLAGMRRLQAHLAGRG